MKKLYCIIFEKYKKNKNSKMSFTFEKTLVLPNNCSKHKGEDEKIFKEEESIELLKVLGLIENM